MVLHRTCNQLPLVFILVGKLVVYLARLAAHVVRVGVADVVELQRNVAQRGVLREVDDITY